jgi:hypothetical protein
MYILILWRIKYAQRPLFFVHCLRHGPGLILYPHTCSGFAIITRGVISPHSRQDYQVYGSLCLTVTQRDADYRLPSLIELRRSVQPPELTIWVPSLVYSESRGRMLATLAGPRDRLRCDPWSRALEGAKRG